MDFFISHSPTDIIFRSLIQTDCQRLAVSLFSPGSGAARMEAGYRVAVWEAGTPTWPCPQSPDGLPSVQVCEVIALC